MYTCSVKWLHAAANVHVTSHYLHFAVSLHKISGPISIKGMEVQYKRGQAKIQAGTKQ